MTRQKTGRRFGAFLCALLLLCTLVPSAFAAQTKVQVNGQHYNGSVVVQNSTTYIPMRHFLNFLGWDVTWHASSNSAFANSTDGRTLHVGLATKSLTVDGYTVEIPVTVRSGRIYLPLRTLCTLMGYQVSWDGAKKLVSVTSAGGSSWTRRRTLLAFPHHLCRSPRRIPDRPDRRWKCGAQPRSFAGLPGHHLQSNF